MPDETATSPLSDFDLEESKALISLAFLVVMADHDVSDEELEELNEQLTALPFPTSADLERVLTRHGTRVQGRVHAVLNDEARRQEFIDDAVHTMRSEEHARAAFRVLADLIYSDDLDPHEKDVAFQVGRTMDFEDDTIEQILVAGGFDTSDN